MDHPDNPAQLDEQLTSLMQTLAEEEFVSTSMLLPVLTDISAYLRQQRHDSYRLFFEQATSPILLIDPDTGHIENANLAAEHFYGYTHAQLLELSITDINCLSPEQISEEMTNALAERRSFFLFPHRLASGAVRQVEVHSGPIIIDGKHFLYSSVYDITDRLLAEKQLRESEARYRALHDSLPVGCLVQDAHHNVLAINDEACAIFGVDKAHIQHQNLGQMAWERVRDNGEPLPLHEHPAAECLRTGKPVRGFVMGLRTQEHTTWLSVNSQPLFRADESTPYAAISSFSDITAQKLTEEKLSLAASVFTDAREAIMITDADANIVQVNAAFSNITGYHPEDVLGHNPRILQSGYQNQAFYQEFWKQLQTQGHWSGEIWNRRKNGELYAEQLTISAVKNNLAETHHYVCLFSDISDRKHYEKQLEQQVYYDLLTGLPNRKFLMAELTQAMQLHTSDSDILLVAYIDLDGFKQINDMYGHATGDQLLIVIARRMKKILRETDMVARIGGDEFVALFHIRHENPFWLHLIHRLLRTAARPLRLNGTELNVSASIGLTFFPQSEEVSAEQLLEQADKAMYQAKQAGKNQYQIYEQA